MRPNHFLGLVVFAGTITFSQAATITLDGSTVSKLSDAVAQAQALDDGPHVINITTNNITDNAPVYITEPVTINGDADGDSTKCDILVNIAGIRSAAPPSPEAAERAYLVIQSQGDVVLSDLRIHPDEDGVDSDGDSSLRVDGARFLKTTTEGAGTYRLNRVQVSGSTSDNQYIPLDTGEDIYSTAAKKWSGGSTGNAIIQMANQGGPGTYAVDLDHCHIGLGKSAAVNSPVSGDGRRVIHGGVYGHCGTDGIRISGTSFRIIGTADDRVRVIRSTNISGGDAHAIEVAGGVQLIEYVDIACLNTANAIKLSNNSPRVQKANYIRILGKFNDGNNSTLYFNAGTGASNSGFTMTNSTVIGYGNNNNPFQSSGSYNTNSISFTDTIFTSQGYGRFLVDRAAGATWVPAFTNCALPTDGVEFESLTTTETIFTGSVEPEIAPVNSVSISPQYQLTLEDYDWSDNQGAGMPGNGPGNINVLRPTNPAYANASSTLGFLTGGAGPAPAGISSDVWMLME